MRALHPSTMLVALSALAATAKAAPATPASPPPAAAANGTQAPAAPAAPVAPVAPAQATPAPNPAKPDAAPKPPEAAAKPDAAKPAETPKTETHVPPAIVHAEAAPATPGPTPLVAPPPPVTDTGTAPRPPRGPIESRFNVRFDVDTVWYTNPSFDLVSARDTSFFPGISVGYALARLGDVWLIPEVGYSANTESTASLFGGAMNSVELGSKNAYAGLSARWDALPVLDVAARLSGGATFFHFEMQQSATSNALTDNEVSGFFTLGGGVIVHPLPGAFETKSGTFRSLNGGLAVEGGYVLGGSVDLHPTRSDGRIATNYMSLGSLERSGPYFKVSLVVRF